MPNTITRHAAECGINLTAMRKALDDMRWHNDCANRLYSNGRFDRRATKWLRKAQNDKANAIGFASR